MGWNDHMDDGDELGNLPPEAFSTWNVDGPFDPQDHWLRTATIDHQRIAVRAWFLSRYYNPVDGTPYSGQEGGFQFMFGGPYDPADVIPSRFFRVVNEDVIQEVVEELHRVVGDEWAPVHFAFSDGYDADYDVVSENDSQPLVRLRERLEQSKQVLALQGNVSAQLLARNLAFGSVITSLESFLWETVAYWVEHDEKTLVNIVTKIPVFRDEPLKLGMIFERSASLKAEIKAYLQNLVWHQWNKVVPLFTLGLGIDNPGFKRFDNALKKRHDIVHRSGVSRTGERVNVDVEEIGFLCEQVLQFATQINEKIASRTV